MKKILFPSIVVIFILTALTSMTGIEKAPAKVASSVNKMGTSTGTDNSPEIVSWVDSMYSVMHLAEAGLSKPAFFEACKGYQYLSYQHIVKKQNLLTICDYSQPSTNKRLYVLDMNAGKILFNTYVSHGHNSGTDYATSFSNSEDSHKTSLGFMVTGETYFGDNGYSMRLDGLEPGFNDKVRERAVVMHGCNYISKERAANGTFMGRSFGCPAVAAAEVSKIIDCIKGGSCFFDYYPDTRYTSTSKILNANFVWPIAVSLKNPFTA